MKKIYIITIILISLNGLINNIFADTLSINRIDSLKIYSVPNTDSIIQYYKPNSANSYRFKTPNSWPIDSVGFVEYIFSKYEITIAHYVLTIAEAILKIDISKVKKGDFLFFKERKTNNFVLAHVCIVTEIDNDILTIMHNVSNEIIVEQYPKSNDYDQHFLFAGSLSFLNPDTQKKVNNNTNDSVTKVIQDTISVIGVGDIMLGTNYPSDYYLPPDDGKYILHPVKDILNDANISFANLEGVLLTGLGKVKKCRTASICYAFKSPDHYITYFKEAGFDLLSLANNHSSDFGQIGKQNTVMLLEENDIEFAGFVEYPFTIFEKNGIKYGFCAFSPNKGNTDINNRKYACRIVAKLDSLADIVIVSFHGGLEGNNYSNITRKNERFRGENRGNPYKFSRDVIDAGADIVFGHGPHVTRAIDMYKNRFIAYSLGNFATYGSFNLTGASGIAPIVKVFVNKKGEFIYGQIFSTKQTGEGGPVIDSKQKALNEIIRLTRSDLPESTLIIQENGLIYKNEEQKVSTNR